MTARSFHRVFVIGAYLPNGGTRMAYHVGRILERDFGIRAIAVQVGDETPAHGIHDYDLLMPQVSLAQMQADIRADDILLVNPSFSPHQFGWRLPGFKLCYVQGFNTYALLDRGFDHYISVSGFVRDFLRGVYALDTRVIPPFIELERLPPVPAWKERPALRVLPYRKGVAEVWDLSFARLRDRVAARAPHIEIAEALPGADVAQPELFARIGAARYFLTLSAAEGFGLVPLEAMALGCTVVGYDGFGGRDYMHCGENCLVASYPDIEQVADLLIAAVDDPARSERIAQRGRETAATYTYSAFRQAWVEELRGALRCGPTCAT
ncbi:MAG: glycosyltransferase family 4 protein [Proteobacteria bacterium]|nr:glycosyltransferase family 4 protein [Pseudomonadota bacterium]